MHHINTSGEFTNTENEHRFEGEEDTYPHQDQIESSSDLSSPTESIEIDMN